jgi:F-type H+-transporting ATPase subunit a
VSKLLSRKVLVPTAVLVVGLAVLYVLPIPKVVAPEISISAETVFTLFGFPITNTLLATWLTMLILIIGSWLITRKMKMVPGRLQSGMEMFIEGMYNLVEGAIDRKWARRFFPIVMTIFTFLLVSNWLGLTPLYGAWGVLHESAHGQPVEWIGNSESVGLWVESDTGEVGTSTAEHGETQLYTLAPMFRSAATDMNTTFALAIISVLLTQIFGYWAQGPKYFGKFLAFGRIGEAFTKPGLGCTGRIGTLFMGFIDVFVGLIETISEIGKVISFSFRLFGNIFAGEVLLGVIGFLIPYLVSLPFYGLELFVGAVQALVFMMLTVAFFITAMSGHGGEAH